MSITFFSSDPISEYYILWENNDEKTSIIKELEDQNIKVQELYDDFLVVQCPDPPKLTWGTVKKPSTVLHIIRG